MDEKPSRLRPVLPRPLRRHSAYVGPRASHGRVDDLTHGRPPNGLQLQLARAGNLLTAERKVQADTEAYSDTLVMQNLGYYQLKVCLGYTLFICLATSHCAVCFLGVVFDFRQIPAHGK